MATAFFLALTLSAVLLAAPTDATKSNFLLCGDAVSLRSAQTWRYLNVPAHGEALLSSGTAGVAEALVIECQDKVAKEAVETGDTIMLKVYRGDSYLGEPPTEGLSVSPYDKKDGSRFYIEDPLNLQSRVQIHSGTTRVALRVVGDVNGFLTASTGEKLLPTSIHARDAHAQFTVSKVPRDFEARCPTNKEGRMCSGQGVCQSNFCVCNRQYTGDYCEHKREVATCKAVGDPHWYSFDGAPYNMYETGEFLFYAEPNSPNYEAVTIFMEPWNHASVITGVTVRRDDDYVTMWNHGRNQVHINCESKDGKKTNFGPEIANMGRAGLTLESGLNIARDGAAWVVTSPSYLRASFRGFNLYLTVEEPRVGSARGLCGNNNKDRGDDMTPRYRWNEPKLSVTDKLRIEDGKDYPYATARKGTKNGRPSAAFYECKGDDTFFNFIDEAGVITRTSANGFIKPDLVITDAEVGSKVSTKLFSENPMVEEALVSEKCKGDTKAARGARECCAKVLIKAKLAKADGSLIPASTDGLRGIVTTKKLVKAWLPAKAPSREDVEFDTITCLQDYCMSGDCSLGDDHAQNVVDDEEKDTRNEAEEKEMAETNKRQVEAED